MIKGAIAFFFPKTMTINMKDFFSLRSANRGWRESEQRPTPVEIVHCSASAELIVSMGFFWEMAGLKTHSFTNTTESLKPPICCQKWLVGWFVFQISDCKSESICYFSQAHMVFWFC